MAVYLGDREGCIRSLLGLKEHYVYVLRRPDGRPFYVGKGHGDRVFYHENEARHPNNRNSNSHKLNVIRSVWKSGGNVGYEIVQAFPDEKQALKHEKDLISTYRRLHEGGPLTNRDPGGGSTAGSSPFSKAKHTATLGGIPEDDPETAALNTFVLAIGSMRSVVLKPRSRFIVKPTLRFPTKTASRDQATLLIARRPTRA